MDMSSMGRRPHNPPNLDERGAQLFVSHASVHSDLGTFDADLGRCAEPIWFVPI